MSYMVCEIIQILFVPSRKAYTYPWSVQQIPRCNMGGVGWPETNWKRLWKSSTGIHIDVRLREAVDEALNQKSQFLAGCFFGLTQWGPRHAFIQPHHTMGLLCLHYYVSLFDYDSAQGYQIWIWCVLSGCSQESVVSGPYLASLPQDNPPLRWQTFVSFISSPLLSCALWVMAASCMPPLLARGPTRSRCAPDEARVW